MEPPILILRNPMLNSVCLSLFARVCVSYDPRGANSFAYVFFFSQVLLIKYKCMSCDAAFLSTANDVAHKHMHK